MTHETTAPDLAEANAILDDVTKYDAIADRNLALDTLRNACGGQQVTQEQLNAASMLYQVSQQREQMALQALAIATQQSREAANSVPQQ